jgi:hypothetical protein
VTRSEHQVHERDKRRIARCSHELRFVHGGAAQEVGVVEECQSWPEVAGAVDLDDHMRVGQQDGESASTSHHDADREDDEQHSPRRPCWAPPRKWQTLARVPE